MFYKMLESFSKESSEFKIGPLGREDFNVNIPLDVWKKYVWKLNYKQLIVISN